MKNHFFIGILSLFLVFCSDGSNNNSILTVPIEEDYSYISEPRERWDAYKLSNYIIDISWACECFPPLKCEALIIDNSIIDVNYSIPQESYYGRSDEEIYNYTKKKALTIDSAFNLIEHYQTNAHRVIVEYNPRFGYPTKLFIDIDSLLADEEIIRRFSNLKKIAN